MNNLDGKKPTKTLDQLWIETRSELTFKIAAVEEGYGRDEIQEHFKKIYHSLTSLEKRRLRKKKINDIVNALQDDRPLAWIAHRLFVTRQCVHNFYNNSVKNNIIVKDEKNKSPFNKL